MDLPKIATDPTTSSNALYFMPDDVAAALARLFWELRGGRITESEYNEKADRIVQASKTRIGVIRNIGG
jgi:hypothetical protein